MIGRKINKYIPVVHLIKFVCPAGWERPVSFKVRAPIDGVLTFYVYSNAEHDIVFPDVKVLFPSFRMNFY